MAARLVLAELIQRDPERDHFVARCEVRREIDPLAGGRRGKPAFMVDPHQSLERAVERADSAL